MNNHEKILNPNRANQLSFRGFSRSLFMPLFLCLLTLLTGCVNYDVGIKFSQQHRGEIVQHIHLAEQLTTFSQTEASKWVESLESRAKQLKGKAKRVSSEEIFVTIPFSNGKELTEKFNQFFNPKTSQVVSSVKEENPELLQLKAEMSLKQSNWVFLEQNQLNLQVDLRALGILSNQGNIIVSPGSLVDLEFALDAPLGLKNIMTEGAVMSPSNREKNQLIWSLKPGQINKIEASFWVPSYLGLGTLGIIILMIGGFYAKYRHFPGIEEAT